MSQNTRPQMTDAEYAAKREGGLDICPACRSRSVMSTGVLQFDVDCELATYPLKCESCGFAFNEILRPVGYEPILE